MNLTQRAKKVLSPVLARYYEDLEVKSGQGCYLYGTDGKKYLDFATGIAVCSTGHCHPKVVAAVISQTKKLIHTCIGIAYYEPYILLAEKLSRIVPIKNAQFFFCQSGSEAVEAAIKLVKYTARKPGIVAFRGAFHGRTLGALSLTTSKMKYREGYEPLLPRVFIVDADLRKVEKILKNQEIAGIMVEPILGEGGYKVYSQEFISGLRGLTHKYKTLLIFDEVQTGIGRTGKWFAAEHFGVNPDVICIAKGIASGFPLGVIAAPEEVMAKWSAGAHGSTFGGNPVSCAAAIATLEVIQKEKLVQNAARLGNYLKKELLKLQMKYPLIKEVRGLGLMLGVDFGDSTIVKKIMNHCLQNGLLLISTGADGTVIRLIPPLIVDKKQIDQALKIFKMSLETYSH